MREVKFAVIGGGFMGKAHSVALSTYPMYVWPSPAMPVRELIVEIDEPLAEESRRRFGFERSGSDWRAAVEDPAIDVVDILLPNALHYEVAMAAVAAGKHVICEKPLALTAEESRQMTEAASAARVVNQVGFNWRLTPAVQMARKLIQEGAIGDVRSMRSFWLGEFFNDPSVPLVWRFQKAAAGSGALGDLASHAIDFARCLVGEITEVNAVQRTYVSERPLPSTHGSGPVDVDDASAFLVTFDNGGYGYIEGCWSAPGRKSHAGFEVYGSTGAIAFDWERMTELQVYDGRDPADRQGYRTILVGPPHPGGEHFWPVAGYQLGYADTKVLQIHDFLQAVVGNQDRPQTTFEDGLRCALVEEAVLESSSSRAWTPVRI
jgi:predicted dehydrogenase